MADTRTNASRRRASRANRAAGLPWVSELQLDAYLQAREALRRARGASSMTSHDRHPPPQATAS